MKLKFNGKTDEVDVDENMPLLWGQRDELDFTDTKVGCGVAQGGTYPQIRQAILAAAKSLRDGVDAETL